MSEPHRSKKEILSGVIGAAALGYAAKKEKEHHDEKEPYEHGQQQTSEEPHRSKKEIVSGVIGAAALGYAAKKEKEHHDEKKQYEAEHSAQSQSQGQGQGYGYGYGATTQETTSQEEEHKGMSTKAKVGVGLAAVAGIGAAIAGGVAIKHHMDHKKEEQQQQQQQSQQQSQSQGYSQQQSGGSVSSSYSSTTTTTTTITNVTINSDSRVRYGSKVALKHNMTGRFLRYGHSAVKSGSSGQGLVYCASWNITDEDWWQVQGGPEGQVVQFGSTIRLKHIGTGHHLHSHNHRSPVTGQQEVSGFSGCDNNDNWVVEKWDGPGNEWSRDCSFSLRHSSGVKLHSHEQRLQCALGDVVEVTGFSAQGVDENDRWRVQW
jgi:F0F1-type ATP synthase membrane subunit c/vacuolar-type H+-ATPase subunit K